jgi:hypothetical protein
LSGGHNLVYTLYTHAVLQSQKKYVNNQQLHFKHYDYSELYINTKCVPHSKHSVPVIKTSQLMLYREIIAVCSQIHTKHINTLCGQNVQLLNVKLVGASRKA